MALNIADLVNEATLSFCITVARGQVIHSLLQLQSHKSDDGELVFHFPFQVHLRISPVKLHK